MRHLLRFLSVALLPTFSRAQTVDESQNVCGLAGQQFSPGPIVVAGSGQMVCSTDFSCGSTPNCRQLDAFAIVNYGVTDALDRPIGTTRRQLTVSAARAGHDLPRFYTARCSQPHS